MLRPNRTAPITESRSRDYFYFGIHPRHHPAEVAPSPPLDTITDDQVGPALAHLRSELDHARATLLALRESVMAIVAGGLVAIAFLTPVVIKAELFGGPVLPWIVGAYAITFSVFFGTLCGLLLTKSRFRDGTIVTLPTPGRDLERDIAVATQTELDRLRLTLSVTQAVFGRMTRVTWYALMGWIVLAIGAALGHVS